MGEAKRRKERDPNYGKPKPRDFALEVLDLMCNFSTPANKGDERSLLFGISKAFESLLEHSTPGAVILEMEKHVPDTNRILQEYPEKFQGTPCQLKVSWVELDKLKTMDYNYEKSRAQIQKTDWSKERMLLLRFLDGREPERAQDLSIWVPVDYLEAGLMRSGM